MQGPHFGLIRAAADRAAGFANAPCRRGYSRGFYCSTAERSQPPAEAAENPRSEPPVAGNGSWQ